jgi:hypothetical protein
MDDALLAGFIAALVEALWAEAFLAVGARNPTVVAAVADGSVMSAVLDDAELDD